MREDRNPIVNALGVGVLVVLIGHVILALNLGIPYAVPTTIIGSIAAAVALRGPLGQALARRIHGGTSSELPLETVMGELDELRGRILELEERVDFSERLLAQKRDGERVGEQG
jgi:hypothetical protein